MSYLNDCRHNKLWDETDYDACNRNDWHVPILKWDWVPLSSYYCPCQRLPWDSLSPKIEFIQNIKEKYKDKFV